MTVSLTDGLRSHEALTGLSAVQFSMKLDAPGFGNDLINEAQSRLQDQLVDILKRGNVDVSAVAADPHVIVFVFLRASRECSTGLYFHLYRIETVLRENVLVHRSTRQTSVAADTWSHRVTVGYTPLDQSGRALEAAVFRECCRQVQAFVRDFANQPGAADEFEGAVR